jgi:hypothetical protein
VPYPGYFAGHLIDPVRLSWVDLRGADDYDGMDFQTDVAAGKLHLISAIAREVLCGIMDCVANAEDTTMRQSRAIRDERARIGCG